MSIMSFLFARLTEVVALQSKPTIFCKSIIPAGSRGYRVLNPGLTKGIWDITSKIACVLVYLRAGCINAT